MLPLGALPLGDVLNWMGEWVSIRHSLLFSPLLHGHCQCEELEAA